MVLRGRVHKWLLDKCFDSEGHPVKQQITFYDKDTGHPEELPGKQLYALTPHLNFRAVLWSDMPATRDGRLGAMRRAIQRLEPLYRFVKEQSR